MKKVQSRFILVIVLVSSIFSFHISTDIINPNSDSQIDLKPKEAISANLAAWIIIAGDRYDHDKLGFIRNGCNQVYEALLNRGFTHNEILYLDPSYSTTSNPLSPYRDAITSLENIQWAIETWAAGWVDATHGLGIYLFDHGGENFMCIPGIGPDLRDTDLNTYLDNLETSSGCDRYIIIYEACHSGSFINPVSKDNRIVVTATDIDHNSHINAAWDWACFSETFWSSIIQCKTIGEAFEDAEANVHALGYGDVQYPWIDDNHDELGHTVDPWGDLPYWGDGWDALNVWIGTGTNCPKIFILWFPLRLFTSLSIDLIPIWVKIQTDSPVKGVKARIVPPWWIPPEIVKDEESSKLGGDDLPYVELLDPDGSGNYSALISQRSLVDYMYSEGDYTINFLAKTQDGAFADIKSTTLTINEDGKAPTDIIPPTISIISPSTGITLNEIINVIVEGDDDQALDTIQIFVDDVEVKSEVMPDYYPYPEVIYNLNQTDYSEGSHTIRATATDKSGNVNSDSIDITIGGEDGIPGYHITTLIFGSIFSVVMIYFIYKKRIKNLN